MFFASIENKVIGMLIYAKLPNNTYFIEYLCVDKDYQKFGIGKNLINIFLQNLPIDASCGLNCEFNVINYYLKFGFVLDESILDYQGEKFYTLVKGNINGKKLLELMLIEYWKS